MGIVWTTQKIGVTNDCWLDIHIGQENGRRYAYVQVGDDMHMNGMDSPATLRSCGDVLQLIEKLKQIDIEWPDQ